MEKQYNSIDIANYIIWKAESMDINDITHLKLQKLLYYVVASYLKTTSNQLFDEPVSKWQYGPVVKSVYHHFKIFGDGLLKPTTYLSSESNYSGHGDFFIKFVDVDSINAEIENEKVINKITESIINNTRCFSAFDLVDRTHQENAWKDYASYILQGRELIYSNDELKAANIP